MNRRGFLRAASGRGRIAEISCERLYVQYLDAERAGRVDQFLASLKAQVEAAPHVRLTDRAWLGRGDFRRAMESVLPSSTL